MPNALVQYFRQVDPAGAQGLSDDDITQMYARDASNFRRATGVDLFSEYPDFKADYDRISEDAFRATLGVGDYARNFGRSFIGGGVRTIGSIPQAGAEILKKLSEGDVDLIKPIKSAVESTADFLSPSVDPAVEKALRNSFWATQFPEAGGSAAGFLASGAVGGLGLKALGMGARAAQLTALGAAGAAAGFDEGYQSAKAAGASDDDAFKSGLLNGGVGLSEIAPIERFLARMTRLIPGEKKLIREYILDALHGGGEEFLQEGGQSVAGDVIASKIVEFDKDREIGQTAAREASAGGLSGILMSVLSLKVQNMRARKNAGEQPGKPEARTEPGPAPADSVLPPTPPTTDQGINVAALGYGVDLKGIKDLVDRKLRGDDVQVEADSLTPDARRYYDTMLKIAEAKKARGETEETEKEPDATKKVSEQQGGGTQYPGGGEGGQAAQAGGGDSTVGPAGSQGTAATPPGKAVTTPSGTAPAPAIIPAAAAPASKKKSPAAPKSAEEIAAEAGRTALSAVKARSVGLVMKLYEAGGISNADGDVYVKRISGAQTVPEVDTILDELNKVAASGKITPPAPPAPPVAPSTAATPDTISATGVPAAATAVPAVVTPPSPAAATAASTPPGPPAVASGESTPSVAGVVTPPSPTPVAQPQAAAPVTIPAPSESIVPPKTPEEGLAGAIVKFTNSEGAQYAVAPDGRLVLLNKKGEAVETYPAVYINTKQMAAVEEARKENNVAILTKRLPSGEFGAVDLQPDKSLSGTEGIHVSIIDPETGEHVAAYPVEMAPRTGVHPVSVSFREGGKSLNLGPEITGVVRAKVGAAPVAVPLPAATAINAPPKRPEEPKPAAPVAAPAAPVVAPKKEPAPRKPGQPATMDEAVKTFEADPTRFEETNEFVGKTADEAQARNKNLYDLQGILRTVEERARSTGDGTRTFTEEEIKQLDKIPKDNVGGINMLEVIRRAREGMAAGAMQSVLNPVLNAYTRSLARAQSLAELSARVTNKGQTTTADILKGDNIQHIQATTTGEGVKRGYFQIGDGTTESAQMKAFGDRYTAIPKEAGIDEAKQEALLEETAGKLGELMVTGSRTRDSRAATRKLTGWVGPGGHVLVLSSKQATGNKGEALTANKKYRFDIGKGGAMTPSGAHHGTTGIRELLNAGYRPLSSIQMDFTVGRFAAHFLDTAAYDAAIGTQAQSDSNIAVNALEGQTDLMTEGTSKNRKGVVAHDAGQKKKTDQETGAEIEDTEGEVGADPEGTGIDVAEVIEEYLDIFAELATYTKANPKVSNDKLFNLFGPKIAARWTEMGNPVDELPALKIEMEKIFEFITAAGNSSIRTGILDKYEAKLKADGVLKDKQQKALTDAAKAIIAQPGGETTSQPAGSQQVADTGAGDRGVTGTGEVATGAVSLAPTPSPTGAGGEAAAGVGGVPAVAAVAPVVTENKTPDSPVSLAEFKATAIQTARAYLEDESLSQEHFDEFVEDINSLDTIEEVYDNVAALTDMIETAKDQADPQQKQEIIGDGLDKLPEVPDSRSKIIRNLDHLAAPGRGPATTKGILGEANIEAIRAEYTNLDDVMSKLEMGYREGAESREMSEAGRRRSLYQADQIAAMRKNPEVTGVVLRYTNDPTNPRIGTFLVATREIVTNLANIRDFDDLHNTLHHELDHAYTVGMLIRQSVSPETITPQERDAIREIQRIMSLAYKADLQWQNSDESFPAIIRYGEFLAAASTNANFMAELDRLMDPKPRVAQGDKPKTVWQSLKEAWATLMEWLVKRFKASGNKISSNEATLLKSAMDSIEYLIGSYNQATRAADVLVTKKAMDKGMLDEPVETAAHLDRQYLKAVNDNNQDVINFLTERAAKIAAKPFDAEARKSAEADMSWYVGNHPAKTYGVPGNRGQVEVTAVVILPGDQYAGGGEPAVVEGRGDNVQDALDGISEDLREENLTGARVLYAGLGHPKRILRDRNGQVVPLSKRFDLSRVDDKSRIPGELNRLATEDEMAGRIPPSRFTWEFLDSLYQIAVEKGDDKRARQLFDVIAMKVATPWNFGAYEKAPEGLLGFSKEKDQPQKGYGEQKYKTEVTIVVVPQNGEAFVDGMNGANIPHAMERAQRNWPGSEILFVALGNPDKIMRETSGSGNVVPLSSRFNAKRLSGASPYTAASIVGHRLRNVGGGTSILTKTSLEEITRKYGTVKAALNTIVTEATAEANNRTLSESEREYARFKADSAAAMLQNVDLTGVSIELHDNPQGTRFGDFSPINAKMRMNLANIRDNSDLHDTALHELTHAYTWRLRMRYEYAPQTLSQEERQLVETIQRVMDKAAKSGATWQDDRSDDPVKRWGEFVSAVFSNRGTRDNLNKTKDGDRTLLQSFWDAISNFFVSMIRKFRQSGGTTLINEGSLLKEVHESINKLVRNYNERNQGEDRNAEITASIGHIKRLMAGTATTSDPFGLGDLPARNVETVLKAKYEISHDPSQPNQAVNAASRMMATVNSVDGLFNRMIAAANAAGALRKVRTQAEFVADMIGTMFHGGVMNPEESREAIKDALAKQLAPPISPTTGYGDLEGLSERPKAQRDDLTISQKLEHLMTKERAVIDDAFGKKNLVQQVTDSATDLHDITTRYDDLTVIGKEFIKEVRRGVKESGDTGAHSITKALGVDPAAVRGAVTAAEARIMANTDAYVDGLVAMSNLGLDYSGLKKGTLTIAQVAAAVNASTDPALRNMRADPRIPTDAANLGLAIMFARRRPLVMDMLEARRMGLEKTILNEIIGIATSNTPDAFDRAVSNLSRIKQHGAFAQRVLTRLNEAKKEHRRLLDMVDQYEEWLEFHAAAQPVLRDHIHRLERALGSQADYDGRQWAAVDGAVYHVPVNNLTPETELFLRSSKNPHLKTLKLGDTFDATQIGKDIKAMREWMAHNASLAGSANWELIRQESEKMIEMYAKSANYQVQRGPGGWIVRGIGDIATQAEFIGLHAGREFARQVRKFNTLYEAHLRNTDRKPFLDFDGLLMKAYRATKVGHPETFAIRFYDRAFGYLESRQDLLDARLTPQQQTDKSVREAMRYLSSDPAMALPGAADAVEKLLRQGIHNTEIIQKIRKEMGLKVLETLKFDGRIMYRLREAIGHPAHTMSRIISREARAVVADKMARADSWFSPFKNMVGEQIKRLSPGEVSELYTGNIAELIGALATRFTPEIRERFARPIVEKPGESAFMGPKTDGVADRAKRANVIHAYNTSGGDMIRFALNLHALEGGTPENLAEFVGTTLYAFQRYFDIIDNLAKRNKEDRMDDGHEIGRAFLNAREEEDFPPEFLSYRRFGTGDHTRYVRILASQAAYGSKSSDASSNLSRMEEELGVLESQYENAKKAATPAQRDAMLNAGGLRRAREMAASNLSKVINIRKQFEALQTVLRGVPPESRLLQQLVGMMASATVQGVQTAFTDTVSIFESPLRKFGFSREALSFILGTWKNFFFEALGTLFQAVGTQLSLSNEFSKATETINLSGMADLDALTKRRGLGAFAERYAEQLGDEMTVSAIRDRYRGEPVKLVGGMIGAGVRRLAKVYRAGSELGLGRAATTPEQSFGTLKALQSPFMQVNVWMPRALARTWLTKVDQATKQAAHYFRAHPAEAADPSFKFDAAKLQYSRRGLLGFNLEPRAFDYLNETLNKNGISLEEAGRRMLRGEPALTREQTHSVVGIGNSEFLLNSSVLTRPTGFISTTPGRMTAPIVGWGLYKVVDLVKSTRNTLGQAEIRAATNAVIAMAFGVLPVSIMYALLRDWYDEEILGKKANVLPLRLDANLPVALLDNLNRVGTFGLAGDAANSMFNVSTSREFTVDSRVFLFSSMMNLIRTVGVMWNQDFTTTHATVWRPLMQSLGGSGYIQNFDAINNLLDFDNAERRVVTRINVSNLLRSAGRELKYDVRISLRGGQPSMPNAVRPWIGEMALAAYANDHNGFREAYHKAVAAATKAIHDNPNHPRDADPVADVAEAYERMHPLRTVFNKLPTKSEYQKMLRTLGDHSTDVSTAIRHFNSYGAQIPRGRGKPGITPFTGVERAAVTVPFGNYRALTVQ